MTPQEEGLLSQLATMNYDIAEARKCLEVVRSEIAGMSESHLFTRLESNLSELLRQRERLMAQLNESWHAQSNADAKQGHAPPSRRCV